jgi:O-antigen/teichoic acid export membrane protein
VRGAAAAAPSAQALARTSALNLAARLASGAATFGLAVLTTNLLDTHGRGVYAILGSWAGIVLVIFTGGTTVLAADLIHRRHDKDVLHAAGSAIAVGSALILVPASLVVSAFAPGVTRAAVLWTAAITIFMTYAGFEMALAQARGDVLRVSLTDIGLSLGPLLATGVAALLFDPTVTLLMAAWAVGVLLTASIQFAEAFPAAARVRRGRRVAVSIVRRSLGVALANGVGILCSRIDIFAVAVVISTSAAGVYSIPVALAANLMLVSRALLTATYHPIMVAPESEVAGRLSAALRHSLILVLTAGILSTPAVAVAAGFVFGDAYSGVWRQYAVLVPGIACLCVCEVLRHFLLTRVERQREYVLVAIGMLLVNGVLAVVGAAAFGLTGAAASTTVAYAAGMLVLVRLCAAQVSLTMRELVVPRWSDLGAYLRVARSLPSRLRRPRSR